MCSEKFDYILNMKKGKGSITSGIVATLISPRNGGYFIAIC
jgi:hypothetical protein